MNAIRLCRDCRHVRKPGGNARCAASGTSLTGFDDYGTISMCSIQREAGFFWARIAPDGGRCGKEGRWFEAKS